MILDETFDIDCKKIPAFTISREYYNSIIMKIVTKLNKYKYVYQKDCLLFVGFELYLILTDNNMFIYSSISKTKNTEYVGNIYSYKVYYSSNLKRDQFIIGENNNEIQKYLSFKQRKKKLEKIKNNI